VHNNVFATWTTAALLAALVGVTPSGSSAQDAENPYTSRIDVRTGRRLFQAQCSTCHGLNATGGNENTGPDLTTGRFRHADSDAGLFRVIRDGVRSTSMLGLGADADDQSVWQLVTYLRSLDPTAGETPTGSSAAGRQLFEGKGACTTCHMANGDGQRLGPDLSHVGDQRGPEDLQTDLVQPDAEVAPRWWTMKVSGPGGQVLEGLRMDEDTFTFRIMDSDQQLRAFSKYGEWTYERIQRSTMPSYAETLTADERNDLTAYLFSLRSEP
jgi:putative heme-binding domain-containing protein